MSEKHGIEETKDLIYFCAKVVSSLYDHKEDDGTISSYEIAQTLVVSAPAGVAALAGADKIALELDDLSNREKEELINMSLPIFLELAHLFYPKLVSR